MFFVVIRLIKATSKDVTTHLLFPFGSKVHIQACYPLTGSFYQKLLQPYRRMKNQEKVLSSCLIKNHAISYFLLVTNFCVTETILGGIDNIDNKLKDPPYCQE